MKNFRFYLSVFADSIFGVFYLFWFRRVKLVEKRNEGENIVTFVFDHKRNVRFRAGQYGIWLIPKLMKDKPARLFTIAAPPNQGTLQISTRIGKHPFKKLLNNMSVGDKIWLFGPIGRFTIPRENKPKEIVLIAGGIGITPMRSIIKDIHAKGHHIKVNLIHNANGYYLYQKELKSLVFSAKYTTRKDYSKVLERMIRRVSDSAVYYISGPPGFVSATEKILKKNGVDRIKKDGFLGY